MRLLNSFITSCCTLVAVATFVDAAEKTDFRVNDDATTTQQNHPSIAVAADGSFVVAWLDFRGNSSDIYVQRFNSDGIPIGSNNKIINEATEEWQFEPSLAVDLSGLYSVVWKDYRAHGYPFSPDIYFQRFDSAVVPIGSNNNITTEWPDSSRESPDIALYHWGGGVVVWADYRNNDWDIYGQIIATDGSPIGTNFRVNDDSLNAQQHSPNVTVSPEGWFAVTWYDNRNGNDDIFIQRFDTLGQMLGDNLQVNQDTTESKQAFPDIAADGAGHFTVVWVDWQNGRYPNNPDIYTRKFDTNYIAISDEYQINSDTASTAQREPTISADRMGNVAIIWADSTSTSFDIKGQMIDVDGIVREINFQANADADSSQLHPDVALDGKFRYIAWADKRNGNFDIYASITQYNDPTLTIDPTSMKFEQELGSQLPPAQVISVDHVGYNNLAFNVYSSASWLQVSPTTATTPANISISINDPNMAYGTHLASVTFLDVLNNDSTVVLPVRFDVTAPVLELSTDTLFLSAFAQAADTLLDSFIVSNSGSGSLTWTASENADWLNLERYNGFAPSTLVLNYSALNLTSGIYNEYITIGSPEAYNQTDSVFAQLDVVDNLPYIMVEPKKFDIQIQAESFLDTFAVVTNAGVGILDWQATTTDPWLSLDRTFGMANDSIGIHLDYTVLPYGINETYFTVIDSASFNMARMVSISVYKINPSTDSVIFEPTIVDPLQYGVMSIRLKSSSSLKSLSLPFKYEPLLVHADSITIGSNLPAYLSLTSVIDSLDGVIAVDINVSLPDSVLAPLNDVIVDFHFVAKDSMGYFDADTVATAEMYPFLTDDNSLQLTPLVFPGQVTIGLPTSTEDILQNSLPGEFQLYQNYPNPFNPSTTIQFDLPRRADVSLKIYNILGQEVKTLVADNLPAGSYTRSWYGLTDQDNSVATGIYFYRLISGEQVRVKKMILLK